MLSFINLEHLYIKDTDNLFPCSNWTEAHSLGFARSCSELSPIMLQPFPNQLLSQIKKKKIKNINFPLFRHCQQSSLLTRFAVFGTTLKSCIILSTPWLKSITTLNTDALETWPHHCWEINIALDCLSLPSPRDDDEVLCLPLHELQCKAEVQIYDRGITITILHKGWISAPSWCAGMCNLSSDGNSATWSCFFNRETCSYTPCVWVLQGHPERLIDVRWQPRLCPPSSSCWCFTQEQRCFA